MFQRTTAINKLLALEKRKKIIQGGTWAGKTYGIIPILLDHALKTAKTKITIVAETIPAVKEGALNIFKDIMHDTGRWNDVCYNATDRNYTFGNKSVIQFKAFDSIGKAKSTGKRDILFMNEAQYIPFAIADILMTRTSGDIWIDFNPTSEFWAHTEILTQPDAEFCLLKYTDNEALPATILSDLMQKREKAKTSSYWANWCRVYIDGEIGTLQGVIYSNWKICPDNHIAFKEGEFLGYGIDWGFSNSPTVIDELWRYNGAIYVKELLYKTGLINSEIWDFVSSRIDLKAVAKADSAEPKTIEEFKRKGWTGLQAALKGPDSVNYGIAQLQDVEFYFSESSINTIREARHYSWDTDKNGKSLNTPIKEDDHSMDALRYRLAGPPRKKLHIGSGTENYKSGDIFTIGKQPKNKPYFV